MRGDRLTAIAVLCDACRSIICGVLCPHDVRHVTFVAVHIDTIDDGVNLSRPSIYEVKSTLVAPCLSLPVSTVAIIGFSIHFKTQRQYQEIIDQIEDLTAEN